MNKLLWIILLFLFVLPVVSADHIEVTPKANEVTLCNYQVIEIPILTLGLTMARKFLN